ncbi:MAG: HAD-IA family hydrolase [Nitrospirota bacterium]|nr:MAG: HAD-IA family hydrolase [Nitrospirota bacterium]
MMPSIFEDRSLELLLFDFDGTLIDSKVDIATSVNLTLRDLGLPERTPDEIFGFVGDGVKRLLRLSVGEENLAQYEEALRIFRLHYLTHCLDTTRFYPGIGAVLQHFHPVHKAVVTNKSLEYTLKIVEGLQVTELFTAIESPEDSSELKPDPGMLLRALDKVGVSPDRAIMVGDSTNDVRAAKAANMKVCAVGYGYGHREKVMALDPDYYCEKPEDLIDALGVNPFSHRSDANSP